MKKLFVLIAIMSLLLSGCSLEVRAPEPVVTLAKVFDATYNAESYQVDYNGKMQVLFSSDSILSSQDIFKDMFNNILISGTTKYANTAGNRKQLTRYSVDINDLVMNFDMYSDNDIIAIEYPLVGKYLVFENYSDDFQFNGYDRVIEELADIYYYYDDENSEAYVKEFKELFSQDILKSLISHLEPGDISLVDDYQFKQSDETIKQRAVVININSNVLARLLNGLVDDVLLTDKAYQLYNKHFGTEFIDDYAAYVEYVQEAVLLNIEYYFEYGSAALFKNLNAKFAISYDQDYRATLVDMRFGMAYQEYSYYMVGDQVDVLFQMISQYRYQPVSITKPEINDDNSIDMRNQMKSGWSY